MESKGLQPRLLYPAILSFKIECQIRIFPDRWKAYTSTKQALQDMLKVTALRERGKDRERHRERKRERNTGTKADE